MDFIFERVKDKNPDGSLNIMYVISCLHVLVCSGVGKKLELYLTLSYVVTRSSGSLDSATYHDSFRVNGCVIQERERKAVNRTKTSRHEGNQDGKAHSALVKYSLPR